MPAHSCSRAVLVTVASTLLTIGCSTSQPPPLESASPGQTGDIDVPAGSAIKVGDGYTVVGAIQPVRNVCVVFRPRNDTTAGQFSELNIVDATSKSDLAFSMGLGLAAMFSTGVTRVDGKAELYHESKISNTQRTLVVKGASRNVEQSGVNWQLTPEARAALERGGLAAFEEMCGQMFASSVRDGAEVWGVINFSSTLQDQVDSASAYVKGEGLNWTGSANLAATVRTKFGNTQMEVRFTRSGGVGEPLASGWDEMVKAASDVPRLARAHPVPLTFTLMSYDRFVHPILDSMGRADSTAAFPTLEDVEPLRADLGAFAALMEDAGYVIQNREQYAFGRGITTADVDSVRRKALALFTQVRRAADACLKGTAGACTSPFGGTAADSAFRLRKGLPLRLRTPQGLERWWPAADVRDALEHDLRVFAVRTCAAPAAEYCVRISAEPVPEPHDPPIAPPASGNDWQYLALSGYANSCAVTSDNTPQAAAGRAAVIWACNNRWNQTLEVQPNGALVTNHCFAACGVFKPDRQKEWADRRANSRLCLTAPEYRAGAPVTYDVCNNGKSPGRTQRWVYGSFGPSWLRPLTIPRGAPLLCVGVEGNKNDNWRPLVLQPCDSPGTTYTMQEWKFFRAS